MTSRNPNSTSPDSRRSISLGLIFSILGVLIALVAFFYQRASFQSDQLTTENQLNNQATQIANQAVQIAQGSEQNRLLSTQIAIETQKATEEARQATIAVERANIEEQLHLSESQNNESFSATATSLALESGNIQATSQSLEEQLNLIAATQTAVAQPIQPQVTVVRAEDIIPGIRGEDGELQLLMSWWREVDAGSDGGIL